MQSTLNSPLDLTPTWQPTASAAQLRGRARILAQIRAFFAERDVLEVDTPLLCRVTATDPPLHSIQVPLGKGDIGYLQTSPEFPMKRLLASGIGCIYSLGKAFRGDESGRYHNLEFTMLEWYRIGFDHHRLMDEMDALLQLILRTGKAIRVTYQDIFLEKLALDPFAASVDELKNIAISRKINAPDLGEDHDAWLQLLMSHIIEPQLGATDPHFIYDFPPSQAALAKIRHDANPVVGERFEVYHRGIELANGYHELTDAREQRRRFVADIEQRKKMHLAELPIDENLLAALAHGMPNCAGVALGVDRLVMLALDAKHINEVIAFPFDRV
jgi:elongation factor P--(R)-beta-lysine ligase